MASSSHNTFEGVDDENFDQYFDQQFDQAFENFSLITVIKKMQGKRGKKRVHIERDREEGNVRLWNDYFSETPTYPVNLFRRRFRMNKPLFMHIVDRLSNEVEYFRQKKDTLGRIRLSPLQKCTAAIRVLAYGTTADAVDEYLRLGETTTRSCVEHFVEGIIYLFGDEYLRRPTSAYLQRLLDIGERLLDIGERRGFPGMIGLDIGERLLDIGERLLDIGERLLDIGERLLDIGERLLDIGERLLDIGERLLDIGERLLDIGERLLDIGERLLDIGERLLDIGERLLDIGERRGFPGMIGSIDCMHWEWKNCPTAWKGQYSRGSGKPTIVLEAVASYDLWIWHAFFGPPGTLNDINVLDRSPVFDDIINGQASQVIFSINGREYHLAYYLTDGPKARLFAQHQEVVRKYVERAFGVLQARFAIVKNPALFWDKVKIGKIMRACIILHNMIVEDERDGYTQFDVSEFQQGEDTGTSHVDLTYSTDMPTNFVNMMGVQTRIRDRQMNQQLKADLVEHILRKFGRQEDNY
uniref:DDE Tnp4 domain-containing protein n=1 Tax=Brassica oleracea var. oleracea TaxID=109376 RepID=A0A0D3C2S7_BRAOL